MSLLAATGSATTLLSILALVGGCAASHPPPKKDGPNTSDECSNRADAAQNAIQPAITSEGCKTDSDCHVVAFSTLCFDACTRVTTKLEAFEEASRRANKDFCEDYAKIGCRREIPPCAPQPPMRCEKNVCVM